MARFLCPVCRAPRDVDLREHISLDAHLKIASTALALASLGYHFRGVLFAFKLTLFVYLPLWAISEFLHWARVRRDSRCPHCHFDPILYKKDWKAARVVVETRLMGIAQAREEERKARAERIPANAAPTVEQTRQASKT
jgi:hypothetical protein